MNQLLSQSEIEMLLCFFPKLDNLTAKEVEERSGYSHESTFRILKGLAKKNCLTEKKVGKTNVYEFVKDRDIIYQIFANYLTKKRLEFKQKHSLLYKRLCEFVNEVNPEGPAILFGSFAKGSQTKDSDIDMLCVTNNKSVQGIAKTFKTKYDMNIQAVVMRPSDFRNIKKDNPQFWDDLIKFGIIFDGIDIFFREAYIID